MTLIGNDGTILYQGDRAMKYRVILQKTEEGYAVGCLDLPGCWSQGATEAEALENIKDAIQEYLAAREDLLRDSPSAEIKEVTI